MSPQPGLPVVALVGRPNAGKSTLFNRLVRARRAIVDDAPGVTRDRVAAPAEHAGRRFLCVDTGGFAAEPARDQATLAGQVRAQALAAVAEADCIVWVLDGPAGPVPEDREAARLLARSGKPLVVAVSKLDTTARDVLVHDFHALGAGPPLAVSAAHGRGLGALLDAIVAALPAEGAGEGAEGAPRLALVGRPNVGKSSLLNRLVGTERTIVAAEAGTTRDAIDTSIEVDGRRWVLIDTAGIRRRTRVHERLERHGAVRALGTLERADLALVVLDAVEGVTEQDARLVGRAWAAGRGVILLANKWDLVPRERRQAGAFRGEVAAALPAFADLPVLCVSARTGDGLDAIFPLAARVDRAYGAALPTPVLNRALATAVAAHAPPGPRGRPVRLFYATQTGRRPPAVTVFASAPAVIPAAYTRYLTARFVSDFGLLGVPLAITFRARRAAPARPRPPSAGRARRTRGRAPRSSRPSGGGARPRPR